MSSTESKCIQRFEYLQRKAADCGITLVSNCVNDYVGFNDVPGANGKVYFENLDDAEQFIYGYELGYKSSIRNGKA